MSFRKNNISSNVILWIFLLVITLTITELFYFNYQSKNIDTIIIKKQKAVAIIGLPDLSIASNVVWIRHRSIGNIFSVFPEDGTLLDYYPSSFVYNAETISHNPLSPKEK